MDLISTAQNLAKAGAILGIVLGLFSSLFWLYLILSRTGFLLWAINLLDAAMVGVSLLAILLCYYIYIQVANRIPDDAFNHGLLLIVLGILVAIGTWGIAGLLIVVSGVLVLISETS